MFFIMFVRRKKNRSGSVSVVVADLPASISAIAWLILSVYFTEIYNENELVSRMGYQLVSFATM